jgi:hypothetical protein
VFGGRRIPEQPQAAQPPVAADLVASEVQADLAEFSVPLTFLSAKSSATVLPLSLPSALPLPRCLEEFQSFANLSSEFGRRPQVKCALSAALPVGQAIVRTPFLPLVAAPRNDHGSLASEEFGMNS